MGTSILHSQDFLQGRFRNDAFTLATSRVRSRRNSTNPNNNFNSYAYHNRRWRRSTVAANHHLDRDRSAKGLATWNVAMDQVKILKRGEKLSLENSHRGLVVTAENRVKNKVEDFDLVLGSTDPVKVHKQIRVSDPKERMYVGPAFVTSPPPSFVPVPGFLGRNDAATSGLRRLLRLD